MRFGSRQVVDRPRRDDEVERPGDGARPVRGGEIGLDVLDAVAELRQLLAGGVEHRQRGVQHDGVGAWEMLQQHHVEVAGAGAQVQVAKLLVRALRDERAQGDELAAALRRALLLALQPLLDEILVVPVVVVVIPVGCLLMRGFHVFNSVVRGYCRRTVRATMPTRQYGDR